MDINELLATLNSYSVSIVFIIMFLEALNLTGLPAFVLFPAIGIFINTSGTNFVFAFLLILSASLLGNIIFYLLSYKFGGAIYDFLYRKFPRLQKALDKSMSISNKYGAKACLIGRLIPSVRTCVSLIAGTFKVKITDFFLYSSIGIFIWDFILVSAGYFAINLK